MSRGNLFGSEWGINEPVEVKLEDGWLYFGSTKINADGFEEVIQEELDAGNDVGVVFNPDEYFVGDDAIVSEEFLIDGGRILALVNDVGEVAHLDSEKDDDDDAVAGCNVDFLIVVRDDSCCEVTWYSVTGKLEESGWSFPSDDDDDDEEDDDEE